jgi:hypothetical protein
MQILEKKFVSAQVYNAKYLPQMILDGAKKKRTSFFSYQIFSAIR